MTNKTITLDLSLVQMAVDLLHDLRSGSAVERKLRAALADPVPPAGGDKLARPNLALDGGYDRKKFEKVRDEICGSAAKPALYLDAKGFEIVTRCLTVSACIDVRAHHAGELFDHYRPDGLVPVYSEETVTRLQAEVEQWKLAHRLAMQDNIKLQSELTKARELLEDVAKTPWMYDVLGSVREYVANQSAPADKLTSSTLRDQVLKAQAEMAEWPDAWKQNAGVTPADKGQGEPVRLQHMAVAEDGKLRWMSGRKMQNCELYALPDGSPIRFPLYSEQPAPVAVGDCDLKALMDRHEAWKAGEANGTASMVMPDRVTAQSHWPEWKISGSEGWNACLDEFARLNSEPKP